MILMSGVDDRVVERGGEKHIYPAPGVGSGSQDQF